MIAYKGCTKITVVFGGKETFRVPAAFGAMLIEQNAVTKTLKLNISDASTHETKSDLHAEG